MAKIFIHLVAMFFVCYGIAFSLVPEFMLQLVIGSNETSNTGLIDIRATYGGLSLTIGLALHWLALQTNQVEMALQFILLLMFSMAIPRLIGITFDGGVDWFMYLYLALECISIVIAFLLLRASNSASS